MSDIVLLKFSIVQISLYYILFPDISDLTNIHRNFNQALHAANKSQRQPMSSDGISRARHLTASGSGLQDGGGEGTRIRSLDPRS